jgi:hypothetical protein
VTLEGPGGFAWNHGDFQETITKTWLGLVGPGVRREGPTDRFFSDHSDTRPTILGLVGLRDDYEHDGRVLLEVLDEDALPDGVDRHRGTLVRLGQAYKAINAPLGTLARKTFPISTAALEGDDATYARLEAQLARTTEARDAIAQPMLDMLEGAAFKGEEIDEREAQRLIFAAEALIASVH